jgi:hypothetical protein
MFRLEISPGVIFKILDSLPDQIGSTRQYKSLLLYNVLTQNII